MINDKFSSRLSISRYNSRKNGWPQCFFTTILIQFLHLRFFYEYQKYMLPIILFPVVQSFFQNRFLTHSGDFSRFPSRGQRPRDQQYLLEIQYTILNVMRLALGKFRPKKLLIVTMEKQTSTDDLKSTISRKKYQINQLTRNLISKQTNITSLARLLNNLSKLSVEKLITLLININEDNTPLHRAFELNE